MTAIKKPKSASTKKKSEKIEEKAEMPTKLQEYLYANGKRKTSVARVRLYENGNGNVTVNGKNLEDYLILNERISAVKTALRLTGHLKTFDISIKVEGGGINSQAEAMRHGIAKGLLLHDPALRVTLKKAGLLTRDPRMKERKKYGLHRARRAPQFSKR